MNINFNNLRKQAILKYNALVKKLNQSIIRENLYSKPNEHDYEVNINGYVLIDAETIETEINDLRMLIGTIASVYETDNPNFIDVFTELYPDDKKEMETLDLNFEEN